MITDRLSRRIGRRGACLFALAVAQIMLGWSTLELPPATAKFLTVTRDIPIFWLGMWWLIPAGVGLLAIVFDRFDGVSFYLSYMSMMSWGFVYAVSVWPLGEIPAATGLRTAGVFWGISVIILAIAGWRETPSDGKMIVVSDEIPITMPPGV